MADSLSQMLMSYGNTQADILYYELLDLPLEEFEKVKTVKVSQAFCRTPFQQPGPRFYFPTGLVSAFAIGTAMH